ncbi:unnamed protein product [Didymodactylos carnosus]|uniref:G-protein coupled receptors family 1 profile domain-containing protein n=1 Tax=Didymodactylos carnosus TaxID=1234261 RepID=A0A814FN25_9BILA|nr:unnamed protein product [Didymodactylos carnosus]CAF1286537.1 unnamed protein product [Didymodactylos carnosus]CAF3758104.1 unnamed protein product [Didymodactylos carnosus]CAF4091565.1 unnamed protein product [Didymodactylos carnosus]
MSINCSQETYKIDISTISIKYIAGGWLTLIFCLFGTYPELLQYLNTPDEYNKRQILANAYEQFYAHVAPFTTPLLSVLLLCSTYLTVLVSLDRYLLICWPLLAEKLRTCKIAIRSVLVIALVINLYCLPHWFEYKTSHKNTQEIISRNETLLGIVNNGGLEDDEPDTNLVELTYTKLGFNSIYLSIYRFYLNIPVTFVIPFSLLLLCNGSMIHKLVLIKRKKRQLGQRMRADIRITVMLIVIVLVFLICRSINLVVNLMTKMQPCLNRNSLQRYNTWANLLIAFNGFCNFFLFAVFGQRFREMVLYIFFRQQYPFHTVGDYTSNRFGHTTTPDASRRQSRRYSANESDLLQTISRRRSSATMAILNSDMKRYSPKTQPEWTAKFLNIPSPFPFNKKKPSSSINTADSPFLDQHLLSVENINDGSVINNNTHLKLPIVINNSHSLTPSPSCLKKMPDEAINKKNNNNNTHTAPTSHRTIMFNDHIEFM